MFTRCSVSIAAAGMSSTFESISPTITSIAVIRYNQEVGIFQKTLDCPLGSIALHEPASGAAGHGHASCRRTTPRRSARKQGILERICATNRQLRLRSVVKNRCRNPQRLSQVVNFVVAVSLNA